MTPLVVYAIWIADVIYLLLSPINNITYYSKAPAPHAPGSVLTTALTAPTNSSDFRKTACSR